MYIQKRTASSHLAASITACTIKDEYAGSSHTREPRDGQKNWTLVSEVV